MPKLVSQYNWRASCKKGVYRFFGRFSFFAGSSWFLADWLVLTWKASFRNFFGRLALRSPEITYAKRLSFAWSGILMSESFESRFRLLLAALTACFLWRSVLVFEISRETDLKKKQKKKICRPCFEPVSRQNKFTSARLAPQSLALTKQ